MPPQESLWDRPFLIRSVIHISLVVSLIFLVKAHLDDVQPRVIVTLLTVCALIVARSTYLRYPNATVQLILLMGYLSFNVSMYTNGGLYTIAATAMVIIPALALLIGTRLTAALWLSVVALTFLIYYLAQQQGYDFPNLTLESKRDFHAFLGLFGLLFGVYAIVHFFSKINHLYADSLNRHIVNLEAESERRRQAEQSAKKASEAKSFFLANMTHEIRTPLNGIVGVVDLLNDTQLHGQQLLYVQTLNEASHLLLGQVNDILDFSKIESGEFKLSPASFSIRECLSGLFSLFEISAQNKGLAFTVQFSDTLPDSVSADEKCVRQVVSNIISNAIKYTPSGSIHIEVDYHLSNDKHHLVFSCRDTGLGISREALKTLFSPFTQDKTEENADIEGTGLGLTITHSIVNIMGGAINVESEPQLGSEFNVTMPMEAVNTSKPSQPEAQDFSHLYAMVVEDNRVNQLVIKGLLKKLGCQFTICNDGLEALDKLADEVLPDIVLSDLQMPNMNGYQLVQAIRAKPKLQHILVVALTAAATSEEHQRTQAAGFDGFLTKPIEKHKLLEYLAKANRI